MKKLFLKYCYSILSLFYWLYAFLLNPAFYSWLKSYSTSIPLYRKGAFKSLFFCVFFIILPTTTCFGYSSDSIKYHLKSLNNKIVVELNQSWKFHPGDNALWADPAFDDSQWQVLDPTQDIHYLKQLREAEIGWFRLQLQVDSSLLNVPLAMTLFQVGASEIYLNGKLIHQLGVVSQNREEEVLFNPNNSPYSLQFTGGSHQVLAVRYSFTKGNPYLNFLGIWGGNPTLVIKVMQADVAIQNLLYSKSLSTSRKVGKATFLFVLALLHLFFYVTYPVKRVNLYYSLFTLSLAFGYFLEHVFRSMPREGSSYFIIGLICSLFFAQFLIWGLLAVYSHARQKPGTIFWLLAFFDLLYIISWK